VCSFGSLYLSVRRLDIDDSRESFFDFSHDDVVVLLDLCRWGLGILNSKKSKTKKGKIK
jgi:hypothetical protein